MPEECVRLHSAGFLRPAPQLLLFMPQPFAPTAGLCSRHLTEKLYEWFPVMHSENDKDISYDLQTVAK